MALNVIVVMQQSEHRVLHTPDIPPLSATELIRIIADITTRLLTLQHTVDSVFEIVTELSGIDVICIRHRGMHVLTPELGLPPSLVLGFLLIGGRNIINVSTDDMPLNHRIKAITEIALQLNIWKRCRNRSGKYQKCHAIIPSGDLCILYQNFLLRASCRIYVIKL